MKIIGLCGGSGSGKGVACDIFAELGIPCIDTDKVYHGLISTNSECAVELITTFGEQLNAFPGIDRLRLREVAFSSQNNLVKLNRITHKHILEKTRSIIEDIKSDPTVLGVVIDAPLLFESGFDKECDITVCVIADESVRIDRITKRDNISTDQALARINAQISNSDLISRCDYSVENNTTVDDLRNKINIVYNKIFMK